MKITYDEILDILREVERRLAPYILTQSPAEIHDIRAEYMQGVYSSLMILAQDEWPEVRTLLDRAEEELNFWD